jgi:hypothetical protein
MKCGCGWEGELAMILYDGPLGPGPSMTAPMCLICRIEVRRAIGAFAYAGAVPCKP